MAEQANPEALLTTLTTEHFPLQGARASTIAESSARSGLYFGALSASLVSLGFVAQASAAGTTFRVFALVVLPTVFALGVLTFARLVETSIAIAVVNSVVGAAALALAVAWSSGSSIAVAAVAGGAVAVLSFALHLRWSRRRHERGAPGDVLFPSGAPPAPV